MLETARVLELVLDHVDSSRKFAVLSVLHGKVAGLLQVVRQLVLVGNWSQPYAR